MIKVVVDPVEVREIGNEPKCFADPHILKPRLIQIPEYGPPESPRFLHRQPLFAECACVGRREFIRGFPESREILFVYVNDIALERLGLNLIVTKVVPL